MMLGETEFRHQVESSIRPFRDVLLGLFFVGIGMLIDPATLPRIWHWALLGACLLLLSKIVVVAVIVRRSGMDALVAWRTALLLAVGGEFGFALLAIALDSSVIDPEIGQIVLTAVLFSMIAGVLLIRYNQAIATGLARPAAKASPPAEQLAGLPAPQVLIGGYGRVGHTIAVLLKSSGVDFVAFDTDPKRVQQGQADGHAVLYGDIADPELLAAARAERASLAIVTVDSHRHRLARDSGAAQHCPQVPVIARARDLDASSAWIDAGAIHAYPEAIESSLRLGATALRMLRIPTVDIDLMLQDIRDWDYQPVIETPVKEDCQMTSAPDDPRRHRSFRAGPPCCRARLSPGCQQRRANSTFCTQWSWMPSTACARCWGTTCSREGGPEQRCPQRLDQLTRRCGDPSWHRCAHVRRRGNPLATIADEADALDAVLWFSARAASPSCAALCWVRRRRACCASRAAAGAGGKASARMRTIAACWWRWISRRCRFRRSAWQDGWRQKPISSCCMPSNCPMKASWPLPAWRSS
jgi:voltage-gated potassium channel Kch